MKRTLKLGTTFMLTALLFISCNENESANAHKTEDSEKSKNTAEKIQQSPKDGNVIAYYFQDSIGTKFNFYREIDSMLKSKEREFERQLRSKYENYQKYEENIRKKMDAGEITGYQLEDIQQQAMRKQEAISTFERQRGGELQRESLNYQNALMNKISEAGREFSQENGIDMLFFYQKGGQITYISDAFDVTDSFVDFLNKREEAIMSGVESEMEESEEKDTQLKGIGLNK